jgi:hypothetical protein
VGQSLEDELSPIFMRLADALVEATPEWWSSAELELIAPAAGFGEGLSHSIRNTEYARDVVVPTDEVLEATRSLELASIRHGDSWQRCIFRVAQEPSGDWRFVAEFQRLS